MSQIDLCQKTGQLFTSEYRVIKKDGQVAWLHDVCTLMRDESGKPTSLLGVAFDITRRKRAEEELLESEELYRTALESSNDGVAIIQDGRYVYLNQKLLDTLGRNRDEMMAMVMGATMHHDDRVTALDYYDKYQKGLPTPEHFEIRVHKPDGAIVYAEVSPVEVTYKGKKSVLVYFRNITERKRAEEERERFVLQLQESIARIKTLTGLLPICASCKRIRNDKGYWEMIEVYIRDHSEAEFTHSICPECAQKLYPEIYGKK